MNKIISSLALLLITTPSFAIECTNTQAEVSVTSSTTREDGTAFPESERAGFVLYYGEVKGEYPNKLDIPYAGPITVTCIEKSSAPLFLVATVKDKQGRESGYAGPVNIDALPISALSNPGAPIFIDKPPYKQGEDPQHILLVDATDYHLNTKQGNHEWVLVDANMTTIPTDDISFDLSAEYLVNSPRLDYLINFTQAGIHYIWISGLAANINDSGRDNSVHVGINGKATPTSERITFATPTELAWSNINMTGEVVSFEIKETGYHTISIWMRETGFIMDKLFVTTDPSLSCTDTEVCNL